MTKNTRREPKKPRKDEVATRDHQKPPLKKVAFISQSFSGPLPPPSILDVNPSYVRRLLKNKRLEGVKHGRDWLIERDDLGKIEKLKVGRPEGTHMGPYHIMLRQNDGIPKFAYTDYKSLSSAKRMAKSVAPWQPNRDPRLECWVVDDNGMVVSKIYSTEHHDPQEPQGPA